VQVTDEIGFEAVAPKSSRSLAWLVDGGSPIVDRRSMIVRLICNGLDGPAEPSSSSI